MPAAAPSDVTTELVTWFNERWRPALGAIDGKDLRFLAALIDEHRPEKLVEIGCASGLSTAVLAALLARHGPAHLTSFDLATRFYADPSKPVGYHVEDAPPHPGVTVQIKTEKTSLDVKAVVSEPIDFCFIDAAHKHPWPMIDTLAVLPLMRPGGIIVHHDLQMFHAEDLFATGPKVLLDQLPQDLVIRSWSLPDPFPDAAFKCRKIDNNIFAMRVPQDISALASRLCAGFYIHWDTDPSKRIPEAFADRFRSVIKETYAPWVLRSFDMALHRYNAPPAERWRGWPFGRGR